MIFSGCVKTNPPEKTGLPAMADHQTEIHVKATTFGVEEVLNNVTHHLREMREQFETLAGPVNAFNRLLNTIGEATGIALVVDYLKEFVEQAAEAGKHVTQMAAALNVSTETFNTLQGAMSLVGANADSLVRTFGMLSRASEETIRNPDSQKGLAFKELGIDDFKGLLEPRRQMADIVGCGLEARVELLPLGIHQCHLRGDIGRPA